MNKWLLTTPLDITDTSNRTIQNLSFIHLIRPIYITYCFLYRNIRTAIRDDSANKHKELIYELALTKVGQEFRS